jgi:hypothetical protein
MIAELIDTTTIERPAGASLLHPMREELQRELSAAIRACEEVPCHMIDSEGAQVAFQRLARDGDAEDARVAIRFTFDDANGYGQHLDRLLDHVNAMAWAFWRLHRAERRAYGKEGT